MTAGLGLVAAGIAWLLGCALQLRQPELWPVGHYAALATAALAASAGAWWMRRRAAGWLLLCLALAALAFAQTGVRASWRLAERLPAALEGRDLRVAGVVASLPQPAPDGTRFQFAVEQATTSDGAPVALPPLLALGWYRDDEALPPVVRAGERWRFTLQLKQPHGARNPHGFDRELRLFEQGIGATGGVRGPAERLDERAGYPVERLRQRLRDAAFARIDDPRSAGLLAALAVGDQSAIGRDDWDAFRATGVAHLMSISGLHVTMFAWLAAALVGALWRRSETALRWLPAPTAAQWGGVALAAAYALVAGWGVPAQRTLLMLATVTALRSFGAHWPWPPVLLAAAVAVTLLDPWALLQPGFWLSFAAVGLLMGSAPAQPAAHERGATWRARAWAALRGGLRTQVVATIGLAPLTLVLFQQLSVVGFAANLLAIPWVTLLLTPLALLGALLPPLWVVAAWVAAPLLALLDRLAAWPGAVFAVPAAPAWAQVAGLLAGALAVAPLPWRLKLLAVPLALPLLAPAVERPPPGRFELVALDVGQGTALLVRTHAHLLVYDAGPAWDDGDAGERMLLPLLRGLRARRIDTLVLSHRDLDHVGGAASLLRALPVGELVHSLEPEHPLLAGNRAARRCVAGQAWQWDGVRFELLHPPPDVSPTARPNAASCVLRIAGEQGSAILPGDLEAAQERALVQRGAALTGDVLLVAHHGSRTSSSAEWLDAVRPRVAVVQAGYRNRFGHPAPEVIGRHAARGIALVRSDTCGAWTWGADGSMRCWRDVERRYWHHRPAGDADARSAE